MPTDTFAFETIFAEQWPAIREVREMLHRHPELSNEETGTAAYLEQQLRALGLCPKTGLGGCGLTALIEGGKPGPCVALRADMDALAVEEATGLPFASERPGVAHACGHDAHMAMVLGAARLLIAVKDRLPGSVKLIFQPAEEAADNSGASRVIRDGALQDPPVALVLGQHVWPDYPAGTIALKCGPLMSACDRFRITVTGKGCHGAAPHEGVDALYIAAQLLVNLQTVISRNVPPLEGAVITVGSFHGGDSYNLVTEKATLEGTVRSFRPEIRELVIRRMKELAPALAEGLGGSAKVEYYLGCEAVSNPPEVYEELRRSIVSHFGEAALRTPEAPTMIAEDFSAYGEAVPSGFIWLGCGAPDGSTRPLHNPGFFPAEESLKTGILLLAHAAADFLTERAEEAQ